MGTVNTLQQQVDETGKTVIPVVTVDSSGNYIAPGGGGGGGGGADTQYTDGAAPPANPIGNALVYDNSGAWVDVGIDAPLPVQVSGMATAANQATGNTSLASIKTDLDTVVTNTNKIPASPAQEGGNLATLASAVSGGKISVKTADGDLTAIGTTTQTKATDGTVTSWSVIQLLKGIFDKLLNTLAVTQSGTWTVQPGNTANTTPWLASDHDGTTKAQNTTSTGTNSNGAARLIAGAYQEIAVAGTGTVNGINTDLISSIDVSAYKCFTLQLTGTWSGTVTFQGSNDNSNFISVSTVPINSTTGVVSTTVTSNGMSVGPIHYRYLRIRMTSFSSNSSLAGNLELYTHIPVALTTTVSASGTVTVAGGKTNNNAAPAATNLGVLPGLANAAVPSWTEGNQVLASMDLAGNQRVIVGPGADITAVASGAYTTTQTQADQTNASGRGIKVVLDTTVASTGSVTLEIDGKDVASGKYYAILTGAAVTSISTNVYTIYPGLAAVANTTVSDVLPRTWRVKVTANNANSQTYSVGVSYLS